MFTKVSKSRLLQLVLLLGLWLVAAGQAQAKLNVVTSTEDIAFMARQIGGVGLLAMTLLIAFNVTDGLQRVVPGYTSVLQRHIEGGSYAKKQLASLTGAKGSGGQLANCASGLPSLENCRAAPNFKGGVAATP